MLEKTRKQGFVFGERDDTVTYVAGREHVQLFAQAAAGPAVIADSDYRAEFIDGRTAGLSKERGTRGHNVLLETFQQSGKPGAAPDCDDAQRFVPEGSFWPV
jgi:hypothetical protein